MSVTSVPLQHTQYTVPRKFKNGSKLHNYLSIKEPEMIQANKLEYTLFVVSIIHISNFIYIK